jgi:hypothetical protein
MEEYRTEKNKNIKYKCTICKNKYDDERVLRRHVLITKHYYKVDSKED